MLLNDEGNHMLQNLEFLSYSEENWVISEPALAQLEEDISNTKSTVQVSCEMEFLRGRPQGNEVASLNLHSNINATLLADVISVATS